jgi:capsular exopolysaccharide synthesis family protein
MDMVQTMEVQMKLLNNLTFGLAFRSKEKERFSRETHIIDEKSSFNLKEAYKSGRTNIIFSLPQEKCSVIVITSSWPMEGKTTNCANIAIAFAQTDAKTLIIDADLRKPRIAKVFKLQTKLGLTNALRKFCEVDEAIHSTQYENLFVMPAGHIPPNPAEVLSSNEMKELLDELKDKFQYIIIDTPPVNLLTDALLLAKEASGTIVVARQGITDHKSLADALEKLKFSESKVLGFILNDAAEELSGYYKYRSGYGRYNYYRKQYYGSYEYSKSNNENQEK